MIGPRVRRDEVKVDPAADTIELFGVTWDLDVLRALSRRLGAGTRVELLRLPDGKLDIYWHKPRPTGPA